MKEIMFLAMDAETGKWLEGDYAEEYARKNCPNLVYCDLDGVTVINGQPVLLDECGNYAVLSADRFAIWLVDPANRNPLACFTKQDLKGVIEKAFGELAEQECQHCFRPIEAGPSEKLEEWLSTPMQVYRFLIQSNDESPDAGATSPTS